MITLRKAQDRGHANHGWLDSWHSFSFASYQDQQNVHFGSLRVINEDRVAAGQGFGSHPHKDMEIISYVLDGELQHGDNMGNGSVIRPGNVQRMSAGSGVVHSEANPSATNPVHFLQIWIIPNKRVQPSYEEKDFSEAEKRGKLRLVVSETGEQGSVLVNQDAKLYIGLFDGAETATLNVSPERLVYVHVARGSVTVNGHQLATGDAAKIRAETAITLSNGNGAEVLVFDVAELE